MATGRAEVVALCDADKTILGAAADEVAGVQKERPATTGDFRAMLKAHKLDVVIVASPDHWHALHTIAALESGADVLVQKPISHTFLEGEAMVKTARRLNRVVQVGTQRRSTAHIVKAREFVAEGNLGPVGMVRAYNYRDGRSAGNPPDGRPPPDLDYEMWTGPAPMRPYNPLVHPKRWRLFEEYGNGILGDMGIHMLDVARWFLGLTYPTRVTSTGGIFVHKDGKANTTDTQLVTYDYGSSTLIWEHRLYSPPIDPKWTWGVDFHGEKGTLRVSVDAWDFTPSKGAGKPAHVGAEYEEDPRKLEAPYARRAGRAHMANFLDAVASRQRPVADIEEGHISTALCELGTIAQKVGRTLIWDAKKKRVVADEEANALLRRAYRKPWVYPEG